MDFGAMTFDRALAATDGQQRTLLLGAGFSPKQFHYSSLLKAARGEASLPFSQDPPLPEGGDLRALFDGLATEDFEEVIALLESASLRAKENGDHMKAARYDDSARRLRRAFIDTIRAVHPPSRDGEADQDSLDYRKARAFLDNFGRIFRERLISPLTSS